MEYVDLADIDAQSQYSDLLNMAQEQNLPYPLVTVNGELSLTGSAHYYHILPLVERELSRQESPA
jgi:disulfide oxidoreductase YuzD